MAGEEKSIDVLLQEFKQFNLRNSSKLPNQSKNEKFLEHLDELEEVNRKKEQSESDKLEERFQNLLNKIDNENARIELLKDLKSSENIEKINEKKSENYFLLSNTNGAEVEIQKTKAKDITSKKKDLNEVKKKLIEKYKTVEAPVKAKTINLKESLILIQEQTKRYQVIST